MKINGSIFPCLKLKERLGILEVQNVTAKQAFYAEGFVCLYHNSAQNTEDLKVL